MKKSEKLALLKIEMRRNGCLWIFAREAGVVGVVAAGMGGSKITEVAMGGRRRCSKILGF